MPPRSKSRSPKPTEEVTGETASAGSAEDQAIANDSYAPTVGMQAVSVKKPMGRASSLTVTTPDSAPPTPPAPPAPPAEEAQQTLLDLDKQDLNHLRAELERAKSKRRPTKPGARSTSKSGERQASKPRQQLVAEDLPTAPSSHADPPTASTGARAAEADSTLLDLHLDSSQVDVRVKEPVAERDTDAARAIVELLRLSPFAGVGPSAMKALYRELQEVELPAGAVLFREGEPAGPLYVVRRGRLVGSRRYVGGPELTLEIRVGEIAGLASCQTGNAREMSVGGEEPCELLALSRDALRSLSAAHPDLRALVEQKLGEDDQAERDVSLQLDMTKVRSQDAAAHNRPRVAGVAPHQSRPKPRGPGAKNIIWIFVMVVLGLIAITLAYRIVTSSAGDIKVQQIE